MLQAYRQHVAERAALGIPPLALSATQVAELIELIKNPPAGEEAFLLDLLTHRAGFTYGGFHAGPLAAAYAEAPHPIAGLAYDGIAAVGALSRSSLRGPLPRDALTQSAGFVGVNGIFRLLPNGSNERGLAVAQIRNTAVVVIDPAPSAFGGAGF